MDVEATMGCPKTSGLTDCIIVAVYSNPGPCRMQLLSMHYHMMYIAEGLSK
jgi:hypothetical protein